MTSLEPSSTLEAPKQTALSLPIVAAILFVVVFSCWATCLNVRILSDDFTGLYLCHLHPAELIFHTFTGRLLEMPSFGEHFRPLTGIVYVLDSMIFGINSLGLHFSNLLWHYFASVLAFLLCQKITSTFEVKNSFQISLWTAIIFAVHPFHCEPIAWWIGKVDILYSTWYMLAFLLFILGRQTKQLPYTIASLAGFLMALSSKESALSLPFVLLLFTYMTDKEERKINRIKNSFKTCLAYFALLSIFAIVRALALGVWLGGYYGMVNTHNILSTLLHYTNLRILSAVVFPIDGGASTAVGALECIILAVLYAFSIFTMIKAMESNESKASVSASIFAFLCFLIVMTPAFYVWYPEPNYNSNRLLYLGVFPLWMLLPLFLFSRPKNYRLAHLSLAIGVGILVASSLHIQLRWVAASHKFEMLRHILELRLRRIKYPQKLVVLSMPVELDGVSLYIHFPKLQELFLPPFSSTANWKSLVMFEPQFFEEEEITNISRLRKTVLDPNVTEIIKIDEDLNFTDLALSGVRAPSTAQPLSAVAIDQGLKDKHHFSYFRLAKVLNQDEYQFLKLRFIRDNSESKTSEIPFSLMWKTPESKDFDIKNSKSYWLKTKAGTDEITIHVGEIVNWIKCKNISDLEIVSNEKVKVKDLTLLSDSQLVPQLNLMPDTARLGPDSVWRAKNGRFHFNYDASQIPGAKAIKVEVSKAFWSFKYYNFTFSDDKPNKAALMNFTVSNTKGEFDLSNKLGSPIWHEVRIFALDENGSVLGFSSDPLYLLSVTGRSDDGDIVKMPAESPDKVEETNIKSSAEISLPKGAPH